MMFFQVALFVFNKICFLFNFLKTKLFYFIIFGLRIHHTF